MAVLKFFNLHRHGEESGKQNTTKMTMQWKRGNRLGSGGFGTVHIAHVTYAGGTTIDMAVKSAEITRSESLRKEAKFMCKLMMINPCPQILKCYGYNMTKEHDMSFYNVFLEYAPGGSLHDLIKKTGVNELGVCLAEDQVKKYAKSLLLGLGFLHGLGYMHRDIKPQNILFDHKGDVKIADFGLVKKWENEHDDGNKRSSNKKNNSWSLEGTASYMAPEIMLQNKHCPGSDIWALGCTVAEMITGKQLWTVKNGEPCAIMFKICTQHTTPDIPQGLLSEEAEDFVRKCLIADPGERWTAEMLLGHPFVKDD